MQPDDARDSLREVRRRIRRLEEFVAPRSLDSPFYHSLLLELHEMLEATQRAIEIYETILERADG